MHAPRSMDAPRLLSRGVYRLPFLSRDGRPLLAAIDSRGRRIHEREVQGGEDVSAVVGVLSRLLDQADPQPPSGESSRR